jgi:hypothetical protein
MIKFFKMIPVETLPGTTLIRRGAEERAVEGVNSSVINLVHCKILYKC